MQKYLVCVIWFMYLYSTIKNKNKPLILFVMKRITLKYGDSYTNEQTNSKGEPVNLFYWSEIYGTSRKFKLFYLDSVTPQSGTHVITIVNPYI